MKDQGKLYEVLAMIEERHGQYHTQGGEEKFDVAPGPALRMDLGNGEYDEKVQPECGYFPKEVAIKGMKTKVRGSKASREDDLDNILRLVAKMPEGTTAAPPENCEEYEQFDKQLHTLYYAPALYSLAKEGEEEEMQLLLDVLGADCERYVNALNGTLRETPLFIASVKGHLGIV